MSRNPTCMKSLITLAEPYRTSALLQSFVENLQEGPSCTCIVHVTPSRKCPVIPRPFSSAEGSVQLRSCAESELTLLPPSLLQRCEPYWWQIHGIHNQREDIPRLRVQGQREGHPVDRGGSVSPALGPGLCPAAPPATTAKQHKFPHKPGALPACTGSCRVAFCGIKHPPTEAATARAAPVTAAHTRVFSMGGSQQHLLCHTEEQLVSSAFVLKAAFLHGDKS